MHALWTCVWGAAFLGGALWLVGGEFNRIIPPIWRRFRRHRRFSTGTMLEVITILGVGMGLLRLAAMAADSRLIVACGWLVAMIAAIGIVLTVEMALTEALALFQRRSRTLVETIPLESLPKVRVRPPLIVATNPDSGDLRPQASSPTSSPRCSICRMARRLSTAGSR